MDEPKEIAEAALILLSYRSNFMTGGLLIVDFSRKKLVLKARNTSRFQDASIVDSLSKLKRLSRGITSDVATVKHAQC